MSNLSSAQFDMIHRGSSAAVAQTNPILPRIQRVADALGYQLRRDNQVENHYDANGDFSHRTIKSTQGFGSSTKRFNADGTSQITNRSRRSLPGLFGGFTATNDEFRLPRPIRTTRTGQGPQPLGPTSPTQPGSPWGGPTGPTSPNPTTPLRPPMPFTPSPSGLRPNGVMNARMWPNEPPQAPSPFYSTPRPLNLGNPNLGRQFGTP